jgi:hypothetical protein
VDLRWRREEAEFRNEIGIGLYRTKEQTKGLFRMGSSETAHWRAVMGEKDGCFQMGISQ